MTGLILLTILALGGPTAVAPTKAPPPVVIVPANPVSPGPERLSAARKLIAILNLDETFDLVFVQLAPTLATSVIGALAQDAQTKDAIARVNAKPNGNERMIAILSQEFMTSMKRRYPALKENVAKEYAQAFTADELQALIAFYSSGAGAKALRMQPMLQQKMASASSALGRSAGLEAGQRAFERIGRELLDVRSTPSS